MRPKFFGHNAPFLQGLQNVLSFQSGIKLIRNDLLQLLLTSPGERVMRPDYGSPIRGFMFEGATNDDIDILKRGILRTIEQRELRVTATSVEITTEVDNNLMRIRIFGREDAEATVNELLFDLQIPLGS